jgi:hypothetical protein
MTEETTETLYALGEDCRIVGISGFTVRPPEARKQPAPTGPDVPENEPCLADVDDPPVIEAFFEHLHQRCKFLIKLE